MQHLKHPAVKILHTADWHIGQSFFENDRTFEHKHFLDWLCGTIRSERVDVLLVSGDVFDQSNPSAAAVALFYDFLKNALHARPSLQIVAIAGNHDSAARLEGPNPLLNKLNIHIIGGVSRQANGQIDYEKMVLPLLGQDGAPAVWCMAVPYLRLGDCPSSNYQEGVATIYREAFRLAKAKGGQGQAVIALGHLHAAGVADNPDEDKERPIIGGTDCVPVSIFDDGIAYTALGHIHRAQRVGGRERVRYSGSPLPMSFSETNYHHQAIIIEIEAGELVKLSQVEVPLAVGLLCVPKKHQPLASVLKALEELPRAEEGESNLPYLEVRVLLERPEPALRHKVETALKGKRARLAKISAVYPEQNALETSEKRVHTLDEFRDLKPEDVLVEMYRTRYASDLPADLLSMFQAVVENVAQQQEI